MPRLRVQPFLPGFQSAPTEHGGGKAKGRRKTARPIATKHLMHLCLRSSMATGDRGLRAGRNFGRVARILREEVSRRRVRVQSHANVGNHLHLMVRVLRRQDLRDFLRAVAGRIAMNVTGARKGKPLGRKFWDELAYSRVLTSRREELILSDYISANQVEAVDPRSWDVFAAEFAHRRRRGGS